MSTLEFPARYVALSCLGTGGGGEVWAVRDRHTGASFALKLLAADATEAEMAALVREAVALSGLEGLGVPVVRAFGRLPNGGRHYLVREMVAGSSLQQLLDRKGELGTVLLAIARAAEQLTHVHRAGFFHGDIKPANIIVTESGNATLVDLGLAAPWRDGGAKVSGLTPKYAAPELLRGGSLTARAEVYALGVTLREALSSCGSGSETAKLALLEEVAVRATLDDAAQRHPSADEFASALRRAAGFGSPSTAPAGPVLWPIVGIEATASRLQSEVNALEPGCVLTIDGAPGAGRSALLRRLAWSLGTEGIELVWLDGSMALDAMKAEFDSHPTMVGLRLLVDDAAELRAEATALIDAARKEGAVLIRVGGAPVVDGVSFSVPPLGTHAALSLIQRAVPSLTERLARKLIHGAQGRPGELLRFVGLLASEAVVTEDDIDRIVSGAEASEPDELPPEPLARAKVFLDRGRYNDARRALDDIPTPHSLEVTIERARLEVGLGEATVALKLLADAEPLVQSATPELEKRWKLWFGRAHVGVGENAKALDLLGEVAQGESPLSYEARAFEGLAAFHIGDGDAAQASIERAVAGARAIHEGRVEALALACLAFVQQRCDRHVEARQTYREAIVAAEAANDAGTLGTVQLNLAVLLHLAGDVAGAMQHFEAAVDMGGRSGRRATVRQALLALANTDLYLGRLSRARSSIEALEAQREQLSPVAQAQLAGLEADLYARAGDLGKATLAYSRCADAYRGLGLSVDAAEARLEGVLSASRGKEPEVNALSQQIASAIAELGDTGAHRALCLLATARVQLLAEDETGARESLDAALGVARENGQKDWIWRSLELRAEVEAQGGQPILARRDREEALSVLEQIAARLPRDLREVFWNDSRRRALREAVEVTLGRAVTQLAELDRATRDGSSTTSSISSLTTTALEQSLARILEVNTELLGELDIDRLTARVTDHAVDLLKADRGFVLLRQPDGSLTVHTSRSRAGDGEHAEFSRSIAERVLATRAPVVSLNARQDASMEGYKSVHQLMLESVVCVPIGSRGSTPIGALYIEAPQRPGRSLEREVPTLRAFADQVALALETARLVGENQQRANELAVANVELEAAKERLSELLGERTEKLKETRQKLRDARSTLYGHFGYRGMVGTSAAMRKLYAMIDRVRDAEVPVLITGESGTGKELAARAIHDVSERGKKPFIGVNCGAIPEHLLESELFGHVRGAFTGADRDRKGVIRENVGGSLLLDEIGEMPHRMQAGLLRVLQEGKVRPVGGPTELPVDIRFIFATHRNLKEMVEAHTFREDLYYRIHVVQLEMPALRDRLDDLPLLVDHFLRIFAARYQREKKSLSRAAMRRLMEFDWPGNVRQLEHVLLNSWILSDDDLVDVDDIELPDRLGRPRESTLRPPSEQEGQPARESGSGWHAPSPLASPNVSRAAGRRQTISGHKNDEKQRILAALERCNWNRVRAAEILGIPRRTLYRRLREYEIQ